MAAYLDLRAGIITLELYASVINNDGRVKASKTTPPECNTVPSKCL